MKTEAATSRLWRSQAGTHSPRFPSLLPSSCQTRCPSRSARLPPQRTARRRRPTTGGSGSLGRRSAASPRSSSAAAAMPAPTHTTPPPPSSGSNLLTTHCKHPALSCYHGPHRLVICVAVGKALLAGEMRVFLLQIPQARQRPRGDAEQQRQRAHRAGGLHGVHAAEQRRRQRPRARHGVPPPRRPGTLPPSQLALSSRCPLACRLPSGCLCRMSPAAANRPQL